MDEHKVYPSQAGNDMLRNRIEQEELDKTRNVVVDSNNLLLHGNVAYAEYVLGRKLTPEEIQNRMILSVEPSQPSTPAVPMKLEDVLKPPVSLSDVKKLLEDSIKKQNQLPVPTTVASVSVPPSPLTLPAVPQSLSSSVSLSASSSLPSVQSTSLPGSSFASEEKKVKKEKSEKKKEYVRCPVCNEVMLKTSYRKHEDSDTHYKNAKKLGKDPFNVKSEPAETSIPSSTLGTTSKTVETGSGLSPLEDIGKLKRILAEKNNLKNNSPALVKEGKKLLRTLQGKGVIKKSQAMKIKKLL